MVISKAYELNAHMRFQKERKYSILFMGLSHNTIETQRCGPCDPQRKLNDDAY